MDSILTALQDPILQRALMGGLLLGFLLSFFGIFILMRKMSFIGEGIAHASLSAIALAVILAYSPLLLAVLFGIVFATILFYLERRTNIHPDALIGILFPAALSVGAILLSFRGDEELDLEGIFFGDIFSIQANELWFAAAIGGLAVLFLALSYRGLIFSSFDRDGAKVSGIPTERIDLILYMVLAAIIVFGAKMLGILMVSALLIIPGSFGKLVGRSFGQMTIVGVAFAEAVTVGGIFVSRALDIPTGATIILLGAVIFFGAMLFVTIRRRSQK
jgi:zinc transport system permease protein